MNLVEKDLKMIWHPCSQMKDYEDLPPIIIDYGKGSYIYDINGKEYLDIISSWWCNLLGHSNPRINNSIKRQLDKIEHVIFANFSHKPAIELCEELLSILPFGLTKFNFSDNGSSAVECALKMAFQYQYQTDKKHKTKFMTLSEGYHGETIGALSVGAMDLYAKIYKPMLMDSIIIESPDCYRCKYQQCRNTCNAQCIEPAKESFQKYGKDTCALILEPLVQGSAGMKIYPPIYLEKIKELCDKYEVLLIADEIATGFGRTGKYFSFSHTNISPDIMCLSKGLTGGYMPMSITVTTDKIYDAFYDDYSKGKAFMHSHTYSGNPLGCSAALAILKILKEDNILETANENGKYLNENLRNMLADHKNVGEIRNIGLINAIELVDNKITKKEFDKNLRIGYQIYKVALKKGMILRPLGNVIYFNPPLTINKSEIDKAIKICIESIIAVLGE
ncbi:adenosylmethionine--8-amino-7-oxononanoate transaminase [Fusobacterium sp. PH5-44]|uniref:adenosylmethionine--8-amino-7-oxononanoate transaminase n=1 Tax=unclassified Fusobacterium TaxID=2648384 RepID=UPI003D208D1E